MTTVNKAELEALTELQKEIHSSINDEEIGSLFHYDFLKVTWSVFSDVKLERSVTDNAVTFTVSNSYHFLLYVYKQQVLPAVRIKKKFIGKYKIAWCHNVDNNTVKRAEFKINDETFNSFDSVVLDMWDQGFGKTGFEEHEKICKGKVDFLEKWCDFLPKYTCNSYQPFYFSLSRMLSFPIHMINSATPINIVYSLKRDISSLLKMAEISGNEIKPMKYRSKFIEISGGKDKLPEPNIYGRYSVCTIAEINHYKCSEQYKFYFKDFADCEAENKSKLGKNVSVKLDNGHPCLLLCWVAENLTASKNNNHSNYSTNSANFASGWNPCAKVSLKYKSDAFKFKGMSSDHFDKMQPLFHLPTAPTEPGYNFFSIANNPNSPSAEIAIPFGNSQASLHISMGNTDPFLVPFDDDEESDEESDNEVKESLDKKVKKELSDNPSNGSKSDNNLSEKDAYQLHVRMLIMRKIVANKIKDTPHYEFLLDGIKSK